MCEYCETSKQQPYRKYDHIWQINSSVSRRRRIIEPSPSDKCLVSGHRASLTVESFTYIIIYTVICEFIEIIYTISVCTEIIIVGSM